MSIAVCFAELRRTGHLLVDGELKLDLAPLRPEIEAADEMQRGELLFDAPTLDLRVAEWAAVRVYRACQALVFREIEAETVLAMLREPCPAKPSPSVCYSADLALCTLPDLLRLARAISSDDPLVKGLLELATAWPLSSVGITDLNNISIEPFIDDASLRALYIERIIAREDVSRVKDPRVAAAIRDALGHYSSLAPTIARALDMEKAHA